MELFNKEYTKQYLTNNHKFDENGDMILEPFHHDLHQTMTINGELLFQHLASDVDAARSFL